MQIQNQNTLCHFSKQDKLKDVAHIIVDVIHSMGNIELKYVNSLQKCT